MNINIICEESTNGFELIVPLFNFLHSSYWMVSNYVNIMNTEHIRYEIKM